MCPFVSLLICVMETLFVHKEIFWFSPMFPVLWGVLYLKLFLLNVCTTFFCNCIVDGLKVSPFSSSPHVEQRFQPLSFVSQQFLAWRGGENQSGVTPTSTAMCFMMWLKKQSQLISSTGQKRRKTMRERVVTFSVFPLSYRHQNGKASNARPERKTGVLRWNATVVYPQTLQSGWSLCS